MNPNQVYRLAGIVCFTIPMTSILITILCAVCYSYTFPMWAWILVFLLTAVSGVIAAYFEEESKEYDALLERIK